ncbi:MAG: hypothetical protein ACE14V_10205 [bacterium]
MTEIDLRSVGDTIVLHLRKDQRSINAYTLATTLISLADAAKDANTQINPGYDIEVVVEALSDGSFKAKIKVLYKSLDNLFSKESLKAIIFAVIANYIYEHTLSPDTSIQVKVSTNEVIVEQGNKKIIVPRQVYDAEQQIKTSTYFREKIGRAFDSILKDPQIKSVSIDPDDKYKYNLPPINRDDLERIAILPPTNDERHVTEETAEMQIIRAILEKSRRRWEFSWKGFRIAAPILDDKFYQNFVSHKITIAPGDKLKVRLRILQILDHSTGVYFNDGYEILEVLEHEPAPKHIQTEIK